MRTTVSTFAAAKISGRKLTMLTAYDYSFARLVDSAGVDSILVGDSLGNVILGYPDTISVTMEDIIHHTKAVARGAQNALVVADMPFMSYQVSVPQAVENAGRLLKEGRAQAVKLEGGVVVANQIRAIVDASIPVVGHIGLTPQSVNAMGGFKIQGKGEEAVNKLFADGQAVAEAGAFAVVVECVPPLVMKRLTEELPIPTIGIGAGPHCDGQVLVYHDLLGLFDGFSPKFVKKYAEAGELIKKAFGQFVSEVKAGQFPGPEHCFGDPETSIPKMY
ncbi:MAG: 3-methyl-2-oxobutanoate hydroxymethyltransferase [Deltaproteobacteria bacterium]|jgi:3-methyl-2-oxobutanoate hydroxymethyltransferase|nr:3-methyl-2-oxobutanoate hydroxymethyltransferase [Deltaproteobacteria bacterium]